MRNDADTMPGDFVRPSGGVAEGRFSHHGGRLCVARSLFPDVPQPWLDLSTGINPWSYPVPRATKLARNRLPEPTQLALLERTAGVAFGVEDAARVVATGGTESALRLLPTVLGLSDALIAGPTYGSHADAWRGAGAVTRVVGDSDLDNGRATAATIVNPNNPDGRVVDRQRLLALHDSLAAQGGALIVDEAFAEVNPKVSVADIAGSTIAPRLIVLRSFGKFYGLAGVRLGFVIAAPRLAEAIRRIVGDWPVSADALVAGIAVYADGGWADETRKRLGSLARRLDGVLIRAGFEIAGGTLLYRLARAADARRRFEQLLAAGVLVRPFDHDASLLRFGLPRGPRELKRLSTALGVTA